MSDHFKDALKYLSEQIPIAPKPTEGTIIRNGDRYKQYRSGIWYDCPPPGTQHHDAVNHPSHYRQGKIEVIDFIEDQKLGFHLGNVVKYVCRSEHKGKEIEDLKKAAWYLNRRIEFLEKRNE